MREEDDAKEETNIALNWGKWDKHRVMVRNPSLKSVIPHTDILTKDNFFNFLKRHRQIILKPSRGSGGAGVIQIKVLANNQILVHSEKSKKIVPHSQINALVRRMTARRPHTRYIIQQKIPLLNIEGRPFDIRVMVQRVKGKGWQVTGIMAKVAGSGYFITNLVRSKGKTLPLSTAVSRSNLTRQVSVRDIEKQVRDNALAAIKELAKSYRIYTVGIDMGIDNTGKVWIIEANFSPDKSYFKRLKDKSMYRRIMAIYKEQKSMLLKQRLARQKQRLARQKQNLVQQAEV